MKCYALALLFLTGCNTIAKPVEAPVEIWVDGKSFEHPPEQVELPKEHTVFWHIEISLPFSEGQQHWTWDNPNFGRNEIIMKSGDWECYMNRDLPLHAFEMVRIECKNNLTYIWVITRGVGCGELSRDSVDVERNDLNIYLTCDVR